MKDKKDGLEVELREHYDRWQHIKNATLNTVSLNKGKYPDSDFKRRLLISEHSPIRKLTIGWRWKNLMSWVSVHITRHKIGIEHFVSSRRTDRTNVDRNALRQDELVNHECEANAQALITISRKRLCTCASKETREAWQKFKDEVVAPIEPELASVMVVECIYRGFCPEIKTCGYNNTAKYKEELARYRSGINGNPVFEEDAPRSVGYIGMGRTLFDKMSRGQSTQIGTMEGTAVPRYLDGTRKDGRFKDEGN